MHRRITITEKQAKAIAAQDQVGGKVNSGLMCYGVCEEEADFTIGTEKGDISPYSHVSQGSAAPVNEDNVSEVSPEDVDLSSFNIKKELNPEFWKDGRLDPRIRKRLLLIASDFTEFISVDKKDVTDIIMTGSLANYNWNEEYSDVDLHLVIDFDGFGVNKNIMKDYFDTKRRLWNSTHDGVTVFGFSVELYAQDSSEEHTSSGVYSLLNDEWVKRPNRDELATSKVSKDLIRHTVSFYTEKIDRLYDIYNNGNLGQERAEKIGKIAERIFNDIRETRRKSLSDNGKEISNGNIIFKALRRMGYLDKLYEIKEKCYDVIRTF